MKTEEDQIFFENLQRADSKTLQEFMESKAQKVVNHVLKNSGRVEDAQELLSDCLLELLKRINLPKFVFEGKPELDAYFMRIITNRWRDVLRKKGKTYTVPMEIKKMDTFDTENIFEMAELKELWEKVIQESMKELSTICQICIKAKYFFAWSYEKIFQTYQDEKLNKVELVKSRLQDCKKQFRQKVENHPLYKKIKKDGN